MTLNQIDNTDLTKIERIEHPLDRRLISRELTAAMLGYSIVTLRSRVLAGLLRPYDIHGRTFYDIREVELLKAQEAK